MGACPDSNETVTEPSRALPVRGTFDVIVAGCGIAGAAAAIAAARNGASVCLLEKSCVPGGLATAGNVTAWLPLCDGRGRQVIGGLPEELLKLSVSDLPEENRQAGFAGIPECWLPGGDADARRRDRYQVGFNPVSFMLALEKQIIAEGIHLLYDTRVCALVREDGCRIRHVIIENKNGRSALAGAVVIDATGDADVCHLAGEKTESLNSNVACGWYYTLTGSDFQLHKMTRRYSPYANRENAAGPFFSGDDAGDVTGQILASRDQIRRDLLEMKARTPDKGVHPVNVPTLACLRMTRRLAGSFSLGERHRHRWFEDTVGLTGDWRAAGPVYAIPWRILHGERNRNLLAAGRCISVDPTAWDVTRAIPTCALTGTVAGVAAAMASRTPRGNVDELRVDGLREVLGEQGFLLDRRLVARRTAEGCAPNALYG